ncbi:response regulator transcription factor [Acrocarpospora sp. B8E8]|uniref:response regulator transcription factor n=1 Tax=Acrocarpospora sp. B8E8 TaxID=3153572 RepID=UPI00325E3C78
MTIRLLLVDDQPMLRLGFRMVFGTQPDLEVVGEAGDGAQGVAMTRALKPDVVLMDVRMPVMDGIEATQQIVDSGSAARILLLTTFNLDEYVFSGLRAGASGFLLKEVPPPDLLTGIRAVAAGDAVVAPSVTRRLIDAFAAHLPDPSTGRSPVEERLDQLTEREREVLAEVARGRSNGEIAGSLTVSEATVKTHVGRILAKLGLRDRVQVVVFAYEVGLARPGEFWVLSDPPGRGSRSSQEISGGYG